MDLCLYRNREKEPELVLPVTEAVPLFREVGFVDMSSFMDYRADYDLSPGDTMVAAVRVTDNRGLTTWTLLDIHYAVDKGTLAVYPVSFERLSPWTPSDSVV